MMRQEYRWSNSCPHTRRVQLLCLDHRPQDVRPGTQWASQVGRVPKFQEGCAGPKECGATTSTWILGMRCFEWCPGDQGSNHWPVDAKIRLRAWDVYPGEIAQRWVQQKRAEKGVSGKQSRWWFSPCETSLCCIRPFATGQVRDRPSGEAFYRVWTWVSFSYLYIYIYRYIYIYVYRYYIYIYTYI